MADVRAPLPGLCSGRADPVRGPARAATRSGHPGPLPPPSAWAPQVHTAPVGARRGHAASASAAAAAAVAAASTAGAASPITGDAGWGAKEALRNARAQLDATRRQCRALRAQLVAAQSERAMLEDFFLRCVEEVRREVQRRRVRAAKAGDRAAEGRRSRRRLRDSASGMLPGLSRSQSLSQSHAQAQQLQQQQALGASSAGSGAELPSSRLEDFTPSDRRHVIERMLHSEEVLALLYDMLFPPAGPDAAAQPGTPAATAAASAAPTTAALASGVRPEPVRQPHLPAPRGAAQQPEPAAGDGAVVLDPLVQRYLRAAKHGRLGSKEYPPVGSEADSDSQLSEGGMAGMHDEEGEAQL